MVSNIACFAINRPFGKQAWSIPTEHHMCKNFHCYPSSLTLNTFFHPFMVTTQIAVLTGHGATACNLTF